MEQARISSQHGTHESRSARAAGKSSAAQQDSAAQGADTNGFSFLLASLGDGGLAAEMPDATLGTAADAQDPAALAALQSGLPYALQPDLQAGAGTGVDGLAAGAARWLGGQGGETGAGTGAGWCRGPVPAPLPAPVSPPCPPNHRAAPAARPSTPVPAPAAMGCKA